MEGQAKSADQQLKEGLDPNLSTANNAKNLKGNFDTDTNTGKLSSELSEAQGTSIGDLGWQHRHERAEADKLADKEDMVRPRHMELGERATDVNRNVPSSAVPAKGQNVSGA